MKKIFNMVVMVVIFLFTCMFMLDVCAQDITVNDSEKGTTDTNSSLVIDVGTLTITGVVSEDSFTAYKIIDVYYNQTSNEMIYEFTDDFNAFLQQSSTYRDLSVEDYTKLTSGDITSGSTTSTSTLDPLASAYAGYIKSNNVNGINMDVSDTVASCTVEAGSYLVLPTVTKKVYSVMVGNIEFSASGNEWQLNNATIVAKVSEAGVTKSVISNGHTEGSVNIGEEFSYYVVATVPQYPTNATNKIYTITDNMSQGLTFGGISSVVVKDGDVVLTTGTNGMVSDASGNIVATITDLGQGFVIDFNLDYVNSTTVTLTYKSTLNGNAVLGGEGNRNSIVLTYSNDPYGDGVDTTDPQPGFGEATVYTYGIQLINYASDDPNNYLSGATFEVYSDFDLINVVDIISIDQYGTGYMMGVGEGTYYLKQVSASAGYSVINGAIPVEVKSDTVDSNGYQLLEIASTKLGLLPSTGGIGTIIFTLIGILIVGITFYFIIVYRRKNKEKFADK